MCVCFCLLPHQSPHPLIFHVLVISCLCLVLHPSPCVISPSTSDLPPSPAVPGPVEAVKALAVDSQSVLVAWRSPSQPNGVITKYTVQVDQPDQQVLTPLPSLSRLPLVGWGDGRCEGVCLTAEWSYLSPACHSAPVLADLTVAVIHLARNCSSQRRHNMFSRNCFMKCSGAMYIVNPITAITLREHFCTHTQIWLRVGESSNLCLYKYSLLSHSPLHDILLLC